MIPFGKRRRGSAGIEALMALPVMLVLFGAVSQVLITSQSRVHLEQAAYAAARSALVHMCPSRRTLMETWTSARVLQHECFRDPSRRNSAAQQKAEDAARWALVAAAPTTRAATARGCNLPEAGFELLTRTDMVAGRDQAVRNALCYVFEPGNVAVEITWVGGGLFDPNVRTKVPVRAEVTFRYPLSTPFRRFIYDGKRADGTYWKTGTATVTLL